MTSSAFYSYRRTLVVICFFLATIVGVWSERAGERLKPRQQLMCCSLAFFFVFPSSLQVVKTITTIGFVLTLMSIFFAAVAYLWVRYCSYFFVRLQIGLLNLLKFVALLPPLGCTIRSAPYQIALTGDHFSWSLYQEYIGPRHLFDAFPFNFYLLPLMRFSRSSLLSCSAFKFLFVVISC